MRPAGDFSIDEPKNMPYPRKVVKITLVAKP